MSECDVTLELYYILYMLLIHTMICLYTTNADTHLYHHYSSVKVQAFILYVMPYIAKFLQREISTLCK